MPHRPARRLLADWMGWHVATAVYPPTLRNKTAIVTGANSGIGLETTKALLQVHALACSRHRPAALSRMHLQLRRNAGVCCVLHCPVLSCPVL